MNKEYAVTLYYVKGGRDVAFFENIAKAYEFYTKVMLSLEDNEKLVISCNKDNLAHMISMVKCVNGELLVPYYHKDTKLVEWL